MSHEAYEKANAQHLMDYISRKYIYHLHKQYHIHEYIDSFANVFSNFLFIHKRRLSAAYHAKPAPKITFHNILYHTNTLFTTHLKNVII